MMTEGYNWFDALVVITLLWGAGRGWHCGGRREFPLLIKWLVVLALAGLVAPFGAWFAGLLGLSRFGGRLCAYAWTVVVTLWFFSALSYGIGREPPKNPDEIPLSGRLTGALLGAFRHLFLIMVGLALLAMIPGGLTRFADFRQEVLCDSYSGWKAAGYWERLAPEYDPDGGGFDHPRFVEFSDSPS